MDLRWFIDVFMQETSKTGERRAPAPRNSGIFTIFIEEVYEVVSGLLVFRKTGSWEETRRKGLAV